MYQKAKWLIFLLIVILLFESLIHGFNLFSPRQVASILNILDNELVQNVGNYIVRLVAGRFCFIFLLDLSRNILYILFTESVPDENE